MRLVEYSAGMIYMINGSKILVEVPEEKRSLEEADIDDRIIVK
jgi:hypothetical protein